MNGIIGRYANVSSSTRYTVEHAYSIQHAMQCSMHSLQLALVLGSTVRSLGRWIRCMLEWTPEEASLLHNRPAASVYISRDRDSEPPNVFQHQSTGYLRTRGTGDFV